MARSTKWFDFSACAYTIIDVPTTDKIIEIFAKMKKKNLLFIHLA